MFENREAAARQLAVKLKVRKFHDPLVLAIPRGGVVTGAILAEELCAELDIVLSRKLRAPYQPELAIGAVSENGEVYLDPTISTMVELPPGYLEREKEHQISEIARRKNLYRSVKQQASLKGRSVIVTDDGIATGSTMIAALKVARAMNPRELIVAVPVAPPDRLEEVLRHCNEVVCLLIPPYFRAIGQFYFDFTQVEDEEVVEWLRKSKTPVRLPATATATN